MPVDSTLLCQSRLYSVVRFGRNLEWWCKFPCREMTLRLYISQMVRCGINCESQYIPHRTIRVSDLDCMYNYQLILLG